MKTMNSNKLLELLQHEVKLIILQANKWNQLPLELLQYQPGENKWSIAQVIQHLNFYSRHYIPAIEKKLHYNNYVVSTEFKPGWLGDYFTKLMQPSADNTITKKMKAPKNAAPVAVPDAKAELYEFISHQHQLLNILSIAKNVDLNKTRVSTSLSSLIKLKLGDTFRFFVAHEQRHAVQVNNILEAIRHPAHEKNLPLQQV